MTDDSGISVVPGARRVPIRVDKTAGSTSTDAAGPAAGLLDSLLEVLDIPTEQVAVGSPAKAVLAVTGSSGDAGSRRSWVPVPTGDTQGLTIVLAEDLQGVGQLGDAVQDQRAVGEPLIIPWKTSP